LALNDNSKSSPEISALALATEVPTCSALAVISISLPRDNLIKILLAASLANKLAIFKADSRLSKLILTFV